MIWRDVKTASRWFWRGVGQHQWLGLWLAVALASMSVMLVSQLSSSVQQSMLAQAVLSMGADAQVRGTRPMPTAWIDQAQDVGLLSSRGATMMSMLSVGDELRLVQLKAIDSQYPLAMTRGQSRVQSADQLWLSTESLSQMGLHIGQTVQVANDSFVVMAMPFDAPPLAGVSAFGSAFAPVVMVDWQWLMDSGLVGPGANIRYQLDLLGDESSLAQFHEWLKDQADFSGYRWQSVMDPDQNLGESLLRAQGFVKLSALASVLVAGLAILIAARFYFDRWMQWLALYRATGASSAQVGRIFGIQLLWLGALAALLGTLVGALLAYGGGFWLADYFEVWAPAGYGDSAILAWLVGGLTLWVYAFPSYWKAIGVPPIAVFKQQQNAQPKWPWLSGVVTALGLLVILMLLMPLANLLVVVSVMVEVALVLWGLAVGLLWLVQFALPYTRGLTWLALVALRQFPGLIQLQMVSVGLVLFVLLVLGFVRSDVLQQWQDAIPADAPNGYLVNVQPNQLADVNGYMQRLQDSGQVTHYQQTTMARGRLVANNGEPFNTADLSERGQRLLSREANVGVMEALPLYNSIVAQQEASLDDGYPKVSVEEGIAQALDIALGDVLTFDFAGQLATFRVSSMRTVQWQSFRLNFFFIVPPQSDMEALLQPWPMSHLAQFRADDATITQVQRQFRDQAPGVLVMDVSQFMQPIRSIMSQAALVVSGLSLLTFASSLVVMFAAMQASQGYRVQNWLLMKSMGARQKHIRRLMWMEFLLLGGLAGILASALAQLVALGLGVWWLALPVSVNPWLWLVGLVGGMAVLLLFGWMTQANRIRLPAWQLFKGL